MAFFTFALIFLELAGFFNDFNSALIFRLEQNSPEWSSSVSFVLHLIIITDNTTMSALTPSVSWAQRPKIVFVTINVSDVVDPDIKVGRGVTSVSMMTGLMYLINEMNEINPKQCCIVNSCPIL